MLTQLKNRIEVKVGKPIDNGTLLKAIEMAKSDVVTNKLVMGQDVTAQEFEDVIVRCIDVSGRCSSNGWGKEDKQRISLTDLIALLQQIDTSAMNDCYLHRNYDTGEMELNIELHNICEEDLTKLRSRLVEVKGCAYWE